MIADDGLPLEPIVTPAIGIAGFILLVTGLVYGVVGIKIRGYDDFTSIASQSADDDLRIYIFFSTAYLTALAVTVRSESMFSPRHPRSLFSGSNSVRDEPSRQQWYPGSLSGSRACSRLHFWRALIDLLRDHQGIRMCFGRV